MNRFPDYGKLSGNRGEGLAEGVRVEADPHKKDPARLHAVETGGAGAGR